MTSPQTSSSTASTPARRLAAVGLVVGALLAGGCTGPDGAAQGPEASASPTPTPTFAAVVPLAEACRVGEVPAGTVQRAVPLSHAAALNTAWTGEGTTVAVLLHQTDGDGLCGFLPYAGVLARAGVRVALLDLCGYGQSPCAAAQPGADVVAQVRAVVERAREEGARRVVLVGASMGGSVAVTAAGPVAADGLVDLSGPAEFGPSAIERDAAGVTMPALFAYGRETDPGDLEAVRDARDAMPSRSVRVLAEPYGHGYDLLVDLATRRPTALSGRVARFVATGDLP